jgi:hypothetical protein
VISVVFFFPWCTFVVFIFIRIRGSSLAFRAGYVDFLKKFIIFYLKVVLRETQETSGHCGFQKHLVAVFFPGEENRRSVIITIHGCFPPVFFTETSGNPIRVFGDSRQNNFQKTCIHRGVRMKKLVLAAFLGLVLSAGAFAEHPGGWGIGVLGRWGWGWDLAGSGIGGAALSLKAPSAPVYWGLSLGIRDHYFGLAATGDYYLIDQTLISGVNFGWYLGLGGFVSFDSWRNFSAFAAGVRLPIGISWRPVDVVELFLDVAPGLGLGAYFGDKSGLYFPAGDFPLELGLRFWI